MLDAGSSGSRIHIYSFTYCDSPSPKLEHEDFMQLKPGLSSDTFKTPREAANSLDPLMKLALEKVPKEFQKCTPVALKATAGLRMKEPAGEKIIQEVRQKLEKEYPFHVVENGVGIMAGSDEGVYAWITVNYLLSRLSPTHRHPTAAIMDLGGGSTQIVFEPAPGSKLEPGDHLYTLTFEGQNYTLYQHSYDGYGLNAARKRIKKAGAGEGKTQPCYAVGHSEEYLDDDGKGVTHWKGAGGGFPVCHKFISGELFDKTGVCSVGPCSFAGVYQPSLAQTFADNDIYAFSYFYDKYAEPFNALSEKGFTVGQIRKAAEDVCAGKVKAEDFHLDHASEDALKLFEDPDWCTDLGFIYGLLSVGYELGDERKLMTAKKINGVETGWCLGAALDLVERAVGSGGLTCLA
ncbi:Guanosine-diphosphatase [Rhizophlyctis rosea]|nr:Guanosine-diphosphatase [Rhizophlyctis rosea]